MVNSKNPFLEVLGFEEGVAREYEELVPRIIATLYRYSWNQASISSQA